MESSNLLNAWLNEVAKSQSTKYIYGMYIQQFLDHFNTTLEEIAEEWDSIGTYAEEKKFCKKWKRQLREYKAVLADDSNLAPSTKEIKITPINSFFSYLEIPVKIKCGGKDPIYHNRDIQREEIDAIITNVPHVRDKAFFCFLKDSGLRPYTVRQLQYIDIKEDWERKIIPVKINVPKEKNKGHFKAHYTFIGEETIELLRKYWDIRFGKGVNPKDEDLIFSMRKTGNKPINVKSENNIFSYYALKLGIAEKREKRGKPKAITQYSLRKFFRNNIVDSSEIDTVDCHFFMGHKLPMQDEHYFSTQNVEKFREKYRKAYQYIRISAIPDDYKEKVRYLEAKLAQTEIDLRESQKQIKQLTELVDHLSSPEYLNKRIKEAVKELWEQAKKENSEKE